MIMNARLRFADRGSALSVIKGVWLRGFVAALLLVLAVGLMHGAQHEDWNQAQYKAYMGMPGSVLLRKGDDFLNHRMMPDSALMCYTAVAERYRPGMCKEEIRLCLKGYYGRWQTFFFGMGNLPMAVEDLGVVSDIAEELDEPVPTLDFYYGVCYMIIGGSTGETRLYSKAIDYYRRAFRDAYEMKDYMLLHRAFDNLAGATYIVDSLQTMQQEYGMMRSLKEPEMWRRKQSLGIYDVYMLMKRKDLRGALRECQSLVDALPREPENMRYLSSIYLNRCRIESELGLRKKARNSVDSILKLSYLYEMPDVRQVGLVMSMKMHNANGDSVRGEQDYRHYLALKDSLMSDRFLATFQEMDFSAERRRMQIQMKETQFRSQLKGWILGLVGILLVVTVIFLLVVKHRSDKLRVRTELLYRQLQDMLQHGDDWLERRKTIEHAGAEAEAEAEKEAAAAEEAEVEEDAAAGKDVNADKDMPTDEERPVASGLTDEALDDLEAKIKEVILHSPAVYDSNFSLGELADMVSSNRKYVSQCINDRFKCNFWTLVNQARIMEAMRRFDDAERYGNYSIEGVAESVGFRSRSTFSTWFKRFTGLGAAEYRRLGSRQVKPS